MPRVTRSCKTKTDTKENLAEPKKLTPKKRKSPEKSNSENSSSPKSACSNSLSPFRDQFASKLMLDTPECNKFRSARRALADNSDFNLPGREKEFEELSEYLNDIISREAYGSLYISGAPGTGKTATLLKIISMEKFMTKLSIGYVNCTSISTIGSIYKRICNELNLKLKSGSSEKDCLAALEHYLSSKHKMTLIILDEMDQLCSTGKKQDILYHIFELPAIPKSKLILVGIANALDLTDRLLVRLQSKCELKPKVMHFSAYTKAQIVEIFKNRFEESGVSDLFPPAAIQLLAAKVSAVSGDIRRALSIGKRVIELAELEKKKKCTKIDLSKLETLIEVDEKPPVEEPKVQLKEVVTVLNTVYGNAQTLSYDVDDSFPLLQKLLICTLLLIIKHDKNKNITVGRLHDVYKKVCKNRNINSIDLSEFLNLCLLVETHGIVRLTKKKEPRFHQVQLQWDEDEVYSALKDKQMITNVLNDKHLLSR
ncbi:CLUMA_CG012553, isoform A [Clunio marinus]|uniref:Cell division control protein n=1 Tax=Clunio marinus TaxID=568069 RepID=A0A1J1IL87_9DIPT|nr:CLUMA_CG012553, isoform A [Clunio marinus]